MAENQPALVNTSNLPPPASEDVDNEAVSQSAWDKFQAWRAQRGAQQEKDIGEYSAWMKTLGSQLGTGAEMLGRQVGRFLSDPLAPQAGGVAEQVGPAEPLYQAGKGAPTADVRTKPYVPGLQDQFSYPGASIESKQDAIEKRLGTTPDLPNVTTPAEDVRKEYEVDPFGDIAYHVDVADFARRYVWTPAEYLGTLMPEPTKPGEDPTLTSRIGDYGERFFSEYAANALEAGLQDDYLDRFKTLPQVAAVQAFGGKSDDKHRAQLEEIGSNLYRAWTSGELYKKATEERSKEYGIPFVEFEGEPKFTTPIPRGVHILDSAVPVELANRLVVSANYAGNDDEAAFWSAMGTHLGRETLGAVQEMVADPAWLLGPAKAAQLVSRGGKVYEVSQPILRAAAAIENVMGVPGSAAKGMFVDLVSDVPKVRAAAQSGLEEAVAKASRQQVDIAAKIAVEEAKEAADPIVLKKLGSELRYAQAQHSALQRAASLVVGGTENGYLRRRGIGSVHIPGSHETAYLSDIVPGGLVRKVSEASDTVLESLDNVGIGKASRDALFKKASESMQAGREATADMTSGQALAFKAYKAGASAENLTLQTWEVLAKLLGSRAIEPSLHFGEAAQQTTPGSSVEAAMRHVMGTPYQRITGLNSSEYAAGQDAVAKKLTTDAARAQKLNRDVLNLVKAAKAVRRTERFMARNGAQLRDVAAELKSVEARLAEDLPRAEHRALRERKFQLAQRIEEISRWDTDERTVDSILQNAFDLVASGAGREFDPLLKPLVDETKKVFHAVREAAGTDAVLTGNMIAATGRVGKGDPRIFEETRRAINNLKAMEQNGDFERMQQLANARLHQVGGLEALLDDLTPANLATALERVAGVGGPVERSREAIRAVLLDVFGDEAMVDDFIGYASVITGETNPYDAAKTLANMVEATAGGGHSLAAAVSDLSTKWVDEAKLLRRLAVGEYSDELQQAAVQGAASSSVARRMARLKSRVGNDEWDAFLKWVSDPSPTRPAVETWAPLEQEWKRIQTAALVAADTRGGNLKSVISTLKTKLSDADIAAERLKRVVGSVEPSALAGKIRTALDDVLDVDAPAIAALADDIAAELVEQQVRLRPERAIIRAAWKGEVRSLEKRLEDVRPRFEYEDVDGKTISHVMSDLERRVFKEMHRITEGLDEESKLRVYMSALALSPEVPGANWKKMLAERGLAGDKTSAAAWDALKKRYKGIQGQRFGKVPEEMEDLVGQVRSLIASYEDLFIKNGQDFLKSPARLMREEGLPEFAPRIAVRKLDVGSPGHALEAQMMASGEYSSKGDLDKALNMGHDAAKRRRSQGTVRELMAEMASDSPYTYSYRPEYLMGHYMKSNKAMSTMEFVEDLKAAGVAKTFKGDAASRSAQAAREDYVPMFRRYAGEPGDEDIFATWAKDLPEAKSNADIEGRIARLSGADKDLLDSYAAAGNYKEAHRILAGAKNEGALTQEQVETFFGERGGAALYIPRSLHQGLIDVFTVDKARSGKKYRAYMKFQDWMKPWKTVIHSAYLATNAMSNTLNQILDHGVGGAFNFDTLRQASHLHAATTVADQWGGGSLVRAIERIYGKHKTAGKLDEAMTAVEMGFARRYVEMHGLDDAVKEGLDLGDGLLREPDEALRILRENGVSQLAFHQVEDATRAELSLADSLSEGGIVAGLKKAKDFAVEAGIIAFPHLLAGKATFPATVGFKAGNLLAKTTENQARLVNFIAHMKRTGSISDAAKNVQKFFFNYADLTNAQKTYMRLLFPFVTWPLKNAHLMAEQVFRNPAYFSVMLRAMGTSLPRMAQAYEADATNSGYNFVDPMTERAGLPDADYSKFRLPITEAMGGGRYGIMSGFQTPYESAVDWTAAIASAEPTSNLRQAFSSAALHGNRREYMRLVGQSSFALAAFGDLWAQKIVYTGQELGDYTEAEKLRAMIIAANNLRIIGPSLARNLVLASGFHQEPVKDRTTGEVFEYPRAPPAVNYAIQVSPLSRILSEAIAMTENEIKFTSADLLHVQTLDPYGAEYEPDISPAWRAFGAMMGPDVKEEAPATRARRLERHIEDAVLGEGKAYGGVDEVTIRKIAE